MGASPRGRDVPLDLFAQAEQLNEVSRAYEVEIDGVPLQQMTTAELTKLTASRGLPMSHARGELIAALAKDETDRALRRSGDSGEADRGVVPGAGDFEEFNPSDEGHDPADPDSYLVGATCVVWEGELYTYGGLTPEGEFVESIQRWSGRGQNTEVHASASDPNIGIPPGRYGHSAVVVDDALYVFGGQGQFGCLDDLWRFDFESCAWTLVDVVGAPPPFAPATAPASPTTSCSSLAAETSAPARTSSRTTTSTASTCASASGSPSTRGGAAPPAATGAP